MRRATWIAIGLTATVATLVAMTRQSEPAPGPGPVTPPPARLRAYVVMDARLRDQPDMAAPVVLRALLTGSEIEIESSGPAPGAASERPGWVRAIYTSPGHAPLRGYLRIEEVSFVPPPAPPVPPPAAGLVIDETIPELTPVPPPTRSPSSTPLGDVLNPPPVVIHRPLADQMTRAMLTGEEGPNAIREAVVQQANEALAGLRAFYEQVWRPARTAARPDLPTTINNVSGYRSFQDQARIVGGVLRALGVRAGSSEEEIRRGLLEVLTTRAIPGFSRHHWGTEIDVVSADSQAWRPEGPLGVLREFTHEEAPKNGLYTPYWDGAFPEPARAHYNTEPWHLSFWPVAEPLRRRWLAEIGSDPQELDALLRRAALAIAAASGIEAERLYRVLGSLDLPSYVRNVAPTPARAEGRTMT